MYEGDPNEFAKRFQQRQALFLEAIRHAIKPGASWRIYLNFDEVFDDGRIISKACPHGPPSFDVDTLLRYCRQITDQGFTLEVAVDELVNIHVVSWEDRAPNWPEELAPVYQIRWNQIVDVPKLPEH